MQSVFTNTMNQDNLFHLMIESDIDTVRSICLTQHISYCNDPHFWKLKFDHDNLPIVTKELPATLNQWRKEYIRVETAADLAVEVLEKLQHKRLIIVFTYNDKQFNFKEILPFSLRSAMHYYTKQYQSFNKLAIEYQGNKYGVAFYKDKSAHFTINFEDIYNVLTIIFYHYPTISYEFRTFNQMLLLNYI